MVDVCKDLKRNEQIPKIPTNMWQETQRTQRNRCACNDLYATNATHPTQRNRCVRNDRNATNVTNRTQPTQCNRSVRCALYGTISTQRTQRMQHNVTDVYVAICMQPTLRSERNATNATSGYKPPRMVLTPRWHVSQAANPVTCLKKPCFWPKRLFCL